MPETPRLKLFVMMALQFFIWGAWLPLIWSYMGSLHFDGTQQAWIGSAFAIASLAGMFFSNQWADRTFAAERFLERELMRALWDLKRLSPEEFAAVTQTPNAHTVVELLEQMRVKGMEFAPAQDKQVSSYYTLHRALANEVEKIRTFRPNASMN